jgi:hypothetical protein
MVSDAVPPRSPTTGLRSCSAAKCQPTRNSRLADAPKMSLVVSMSAFLTALCSRRRRARPRPTRQRCRMNPSECTGRICKCMSLTGISWPVLPAPPCRHVPAVSSADAVCPPEKVFREDFSMSGRAAAVAVAKCCRCSSSDSRRRRWHRQVRMLPLWGKGISQNVVWYVVKGCCERAGLEHIAPHDLRRTCRHREPPVTLQLQKASGVAAPRHGSGMRNRFRCAVMRTRAYISGVGPGQSNSFNTVAPGTCVMSASD